MIPEILYCIKDEGLRICELMNDLQYAFLRGLVNLLHVGFRKISSMYALPFAADAFHIHHSADMVLFQHAHRFTDLVKRRSDAVLLKGCYKCLYGSKASIVYGGSCPVKNDGFYFIIHIRLPPCSGV